MNREQAKQLLRKQAKECRDIARALREDPEAEGAFGLTAEEHAQILDDHAADLEARA